MQRQLNDFDCNCPLSTFKSVVNVQTEQSAPKLKENKEMEKAKFDLLRAIFKGHGCRPFNIIDKK